ncbi:MAG: DUF997 domain-containing protein [Planctomycetota bacterium]
MKRTRSRWVSRIFILAFVILTFFCWCPLLYSSYGEAKRIAGVPVWAIIAAGFGAVLFVVEWLYLFGTRITVTDEEVDEIVSQLAEVETDKAEAGKEGE